MTYDNSQNDFPLPVNGDQNRETHNLLPKYFRTDANKKFLSSTLDQMTTPGVAEKVNAFVGRRYAKSSTSLDSYLDDVSEDRKNRQFEPVVLYTDELGNVEFVKGYDDYINQIANFKGSVSNHSLANSQEYYTWDPHIDWDKFVNFREYYWLPLGPSPVGIAGQSKDIVSTYTVELDTTDGVKSYVFTPNGFTKNPRLKLYRGQTYRFEINTPGLPIAFATTREFLDPNLILGVGFENTSTLYTKGVSSSARYVESGVIEFKVPEDAPSELYYISETDVNASGLIEIYNVAENTQIDVEAEILGKRTYKTANGYELSNGMKVFFQGNVTPEIYASGHWYVEGVGDAIRLVSENSLKIPSSYSGDVEVPFGDQSFDQSPYDYAVNYAAEKDYIVINRASTDGNKWSRHNRWFHRSVIEQCQCINSVTPVIDESARATRPIIEFEPGIKLYNHGIKSKQSVTLVDFYTKDVFSVVEGSSGYNVDGVDLVSGMRVLFAADTDRRVHGHVFEVSFITHNGNRQLSLIATGDSAPLDGETVLVESGVVNAGVLLSYDGENWSPSQEKNRVNQPPLFDMFDREGVNLADAVVYPASTFNGNKIFSYREGAGAADSVLGFPLTYRNIVNIGDIVFDFDLTGKTFEYQTDNDTTDVVSTETMYLKKYNRTASDFEYVDGWTVAENQSSQAVIRQYEYSDSSQYLIDVFDHASVDQIMANVYVNGIRLDKSLVAISQTEKGKYVNVSKKLSNTDTIVIKYQSDADKNSNGFYEMPINFERNPLNDSVTAFTLGEVNEHVDSIIEDLKDFSGIYPGNSNLRNLGNVTRYGKKFVQHSSPLNLALYHMTDKSSHVIKAIRYAKKEYTKFKKQFIQETETSEFHGSIRDHVDFILNKINSGKNDTDSFFASDMVAYSNGQLTSVRVKNESQKYFSLSDIFSLNQLSVRSVLVYLNNDQLVYGEDYHFENQFVVIDVVINQDDLVEIYEYENTNGSYIPPTPTKLGLYPKYLPCIYEDDTYFDNTVMIRGHDGSVTPAFGDYRDELILELEKRIYNNIKTDYDGGLLNLYDLIGGKFRKTGISKEKINDVVIVDFSQWLEDVGNVDYSQNNFWDKDNSFTFNYSNTTDHTGEEIYGFWRSIAKYFYDTDRPHTAPWEMLGYSIKPNWWTSVYGPAPYTCNNTLLWKDLESGTIREPGKVVRKDSRFARPGLAKIIPVDEHGDLVDPISAGIVNNFNLIKTNKAFVFGDNAPVETAWKRSSDYPFALLVAWVLSQPARLHGLGFDTSRTKRDVTGKIVYTETNKRIRLKDLVFPNTSTTSKISLTAGLINYIADWTASVVDTGSARYKTQLTNLNNQMAIRLGGFADKSKLKLLLDSRSPLNTTDVFVPDENYKIVLNTSSPLEIVTLSGIIFEKTSNGYLVNGYDREYPVFEIRGIRETQSDAEITVGGISESFVNWNSRKEYPIGTVVRYDNFYYRTKISHTSGDDFDQTKFVKLAELPVVGGVKAKIRKSFTEDIVKVPYGTLFPDVQSVVDFMCGYDKHLKEVGFVFDYFNNETETLEDMRLCIQEFMFWTAQNWDEGTILTVSPVANTVSFSRPYTVVDNMYDSYYEYNLLTGDGTLLAREFTNVYRDSHNQFTVKPVGMTDGIYLVKLPLVQQEHLVLLDNITVFNDIIFDQVPGYRQERIKLVGYRTADWNGSLNIPGFFYDNAKVVLWQPWTDYSAAALVKYKEYYYSANEKHTSTEFFEADKWTFLSERPTAELLPNWDYRINQFSDFYDLDSDNFDTEQQRLAQHLIGYQKRNYLANIITDDVSQYKFYQGFIQDKGTNNSLTKLFDALNNSNKDSLEFYEEWAIRLGQYGAVSSIQEVEYILDESKFKQEPQVIELTDSVSFNRTDLVYEIPKSSVYLRPEDYTHSPFPTNADFEVYTKDSGYVRNQDVDIAVRSKDDIFDLDTAVLKPGQLIWVTDGEPLTWNIYNVAKVNNRIVDIQDVDYETETGTIETGISLVFKDITDFVVGDMIGISSSIDNLNSFFTIDKVYLNRVVIQQKITIPSDGISIQQVYKLVKRRFDTEDSINLLFHNTRTTGADRVWVDNSSLGTWAVYENKTAFSPLQELTSPSTGNSQFGSSLAVNRSNTVMIVGSPLENSSDGAVRIYSRPSSILEWTLSQQLVQTTAIPGSKFGESVSITANGEYVAIGAPEEDSKGSVYLFKKTLGGAYSLDYVILPQTDTENQHFGQTVNVVTTPNSTRLITGNRENYGNVFIYEKANGTDDWQLVKTISGASDSIIESKVAATESGETVLVTATNELAREVLVYKKVEEDWTQTQVLASSSGADREYAYDVAISPHGDYVAVSAPRNTTKGVDSGCVYVFLHHNGEYILYQTVFAPFAEYNEMFGTGVDFSDNKLAISSKNGDMVSVAACDGGTTTFDENATVFVDKTKDVGKIYVYQLIGSRYVYGEELNKFKQTTFSEFEKNVEKIRFNAVDNFVINGDHVYIGLCNSTIGLDTGVVIDCVAFADSWNIVASQDPVVDVSRIRRCFLYNNTNKEIIADVDIIDPRQGKIATPAEQELSYKTFYDPATYNTADNLPFGEIVNVDVTNAWTTDHVGKLWWNLNSSSWYNPYHGTTQTKTAYWNLEIFGSVSVCEWVETDLTPREWTAKANTADGFEKGISGVPLYLDIYSVRRVFDKQTNSFKQKYYYWVSSKRTLPNIGNRQRTAFEVEQLISDPATTGYRFATLMAPNQFALYNVKSLVDAKDTVLHFTISNRSDMNANVHSEYQLLTENLETSVPNQYIETKWIDSLVGYDQNRRQVPDRFLSPRERYGILNTPRQSMFKDRKEAVKQLVERVNSILANNQIADTCDLSALVAVDEIPEFALGGYDTSVVSRNELRFVSVAKVKPARLSIRTENTKVVGIVVDDPGNGYKTAPVVVIDTTTGHGAVVKCYINNLGQVTRATVLEGGNNYKDSDSVVVRNFSVLIETDQLIGGRWSVVSWNTDTQEWEITKNQKFNTAQFWNYTDWYATGYSEVTPPDFVVEQTYQLYSLPDTVGDIIKVNNVGTGGWLLLEKINSVDTENYNINYRTVGRKNGTIQLSNMLYEFTETTGGFDVSVYDIALYDREPMVELRNIMQALKTDILVGDLAVEWNRLFFSSVRYAMSEQIFLDWIFKTSLIRAKHNLGDLQQKITYQNDNLSNYEEYVNEVKPYSTKIREYISSYDATDDTKSLVTDFDIPPNYDPYTGQITTVTATVSNGTVNDLEERYTFEPYDQWYTSLGYYIERIDVVDPGSGYLNTPTVVIEGNRGTTATAFLSKGSVSKIQVSSNLASNTEGDQTITGKYLTAPKITIEGSVIEGGTPARAVAILGGSDVRASYLTMKFDRIQKSYTLNNLNVNEEFVGDGVRTAFELRWPIETNSKTYSVLIGSELQLTGDFSVSNEVDTSGDYTTVKGTIIFANPPESGEIIKINYQKNSSVFDAVDRIHHYYRPNEGMYGVELSQLMDGVEYDGVQVTGYDFGTNRGWDVLGWSFLPWDSYDVNYDDQSFKVDENTVVIDLPAPFENNMIYNLYLLTKFNDGTVKTNIRLDSPDYDPLDPSASPEGTVCNSITGDGVSQQLVLADYDITVAPNSEGYTELVVRKITSDGSYAAGDFTYDTQLSGGDLLYTTATGVDAASVIVDGDGFVTPLTSKGPEELVPGQVFDTLDMKVYQRANNGTGVVGTAYYRTSSNVTTYNLPAVPQTVDDVFVKIDNNLLDKTEYTVDLMQKTVSFESVANGGLLTVNTFGTNGMNILEKQQFVVNQLPVSYEFVVTWNEEISAFVSINGAMLSSSDYDILSDAGITRIVISDTLVSLGDIVQIVLYQGNALFSQVQIDQSFVPDGVTAEYTPTSVFTGSEPAAYSMLVKINDKVLTPGYCVTTKITQNKEYDVGRWYFKGVQLKKSDIMVYVDDVKVAPNKYTFDRYAHTIKFTTKSLTPEGATLKIFVAYNREYTVVDGAIVFDQAPQTGDRVTVYTFGDYDSNKFVRSSYKVTSSASFDKTASDYYQRNLLTTGEIKLQTKAQDVNYVWVMKNGAILTPNIDFKLANDGTVLKLISYPKEDDMIDILQFTADVSTERFGFRVFKDMLNRYHYKRLRDEKTFSLATPLNYYDTQIVLNSTDGLYVPNPQKNIPGVLFVDSERIEYFQIQGNELKQLRRGTLGTGVKPIYEEGTLAVDQSITETIPYSDKIEKTTIVTETSKTEYNIDITAQLSVIELEACESLSGVVEITTNGAHNLSPGNWIHVVSTVSEINGSHFIVATPSLNKFVVHIDMNNTSEPVSGTVYTTTDSIDVVFAGKKLNKNGKVFYDIAKGHNASDALEQIPPEFFIFYDSETDRAILKLQPLDIFGNPVSIQNGLFVDIIAKSGKSWTSLGESFNQANNQIINFIKSSTTRIIQ